MALWLLALWLLAVWIVASVFGLAVAVAAGERTELLRQLNHSNGRAMTAVAHGVTEAQVVLAMAAPGGLRLLTHPRFERRLARVRHGLEVTIDHVTLEHLRCPW